MNSGNNGQLMTVSSMFRDYSVAIDEELPAGLAAAAGRSAVHLIVDANVLRLHRSHPVFGLDAASITEVVPEEAHKTLSTVHGIVEKLLTCNVAKRDVLLVVGGGLTQDVGQFTASILKRGMQWLFVPTTLLAMCDSCIGSKCGINVGGFKNQVGAFWPPSHVSLELGFLDTLDAVNLCNGIGEILKVHLIEGGDGLADLKHAHERLLTDRGVLRRFVAGSLRIKKAIVETDELDRDYRNILNFGHTFGHAIEAYTDNAVPHGVAVTIGMDIANAVAVSHGFLAPETAAELHNLLRAHIPFDTLDFSDRRRMAEALCRDKKFDGERLGVILCRGAEQMVRVKLPVDEALLGLIARYAEEFTRNAGAGNARACGSAPDPLCLVPESDTAELARAS